jgi:hypothetical protein
MRKIAFCFLIYDIINQEEVWNLFFKDIDPNKYSIYIHYKIGTPLKYFEKYKLTNCVETKYADISLVKAQNLMLEEGLKDVDNEHFIILSHACIPFKSFDYIYNNLNPSFSYFTEINTFPRCFKMVFKRRDLKKSHQWCILNKKHSIEMLNPTLHLDLFEPIYASDEHFYITNIYMKKLQNEIITRSHKEINTTTFADWSNPIKTGHPKEFTEIHDNQFITILKNDHLFGRKFNASCQLLDKQYYIDIITNK